MRRKTLRPTTIPREYRPVPWSTSPPWFTLALLFTLWLLPPTTGCAEDNLVLGADEQAWLKAHPVIRLGIDPGYGPYSFIDEQGHIKGVVADLLPNIERSLGIHFDIVSNLAWPELMQALRDKRIDAVATVVKLPERESFIAFSKPYLSTPLVIMTRSETPPLQSMSDLESLRLALVRGYSSSKQLVNRFPQLKPEYVDSPAEGLRAVASGVADAYVGVLGVNSFLASRNGISNLKVNTAFDMADNTQRFGVRKDWPQLALLLDKALMAIPEEHKQQTYARWLPPHIDQLGRLGGSGNIKRLFPWLASALVLVLLAYVVVLFWNRQLQKNLTERTTAQEQALAAAEQREAILESVFNALPDLFFLMRPDGTIIEYRARHEGDLYAPPEKFLGRRMQDVVPADVAAKFVQALEQIEQGPGLIRYDYDLILGDSKRRFEARLNRLPIDDRIVAVIRDITEEHDSRTALSASETRLKEAQRLAHIGSWELDLVSGKLHWSDEVFRIFELDPQRFGASYEAFLDAIHPDDRERVNRSYTASVETRTPYFISHRLKFDDGRIKYVEERGTTSYAANGTPLRSLGTVQDITERFEQNRELEKVRHMLEALIEGSSDAIFIKDKEGSYQLVNQAICQLLKQDRKDIIGATDFDLFPEAAAKRFRADDRRIMESGEVATYEESVPDGDGFAPYLTTKGPLQINGRVYGVFAIARDISKIKAATEAIRASEARYRQLMETMGDGFVSLDRNWRYTYVNPRATELLGRPAEALIGNNIWELFPEAVGQPFYDAYHRVMTERKPVQIEEYYAPWDRWFENRIQPTDEGICIFFQEVTERKHAEIALQKSRDELEARVEERTAQLATANQELETFTYSVSHDLKAPLRGIDGYSRLLLEDYADHLDDEGREFLSNIRNGVTQMNQLIEDLLAYSRMERRDLKIQSLNLAKQVRQVLSERQPMLEEAKTALKLDLDNLEVRADPEGLAMILRNLFDNAIKFSAASHPPQIEISGTQTAETVILAIKDNGIGFDMRFHDRIFTIFHRLQRAEEYPGTGVGLAIVHKAAERMKGRVWAESSPGKGATFYLELPR